MQTGESTSDELHNLRRTMRDLVALSTLPAVWTRLSAAGIAESLADVLLRMLGLNLIFIRLESSELGPPIEVARTSRRGSHPEDEASAVRHAILPALETDAHDSPLIKDPTGGGALRTAVVRFGQIAGYGRLVACCSRHDFPTEADRLLLGVGANQTAIVLGRKRAEADLHQSQEELNAALAALRAADRRKDEFLATLAHELRNPMAPVRNCLEILKLSGGEIDVLQEVRGTMERQVGQMVRLIDDLLDLSRITRDKIELRKERIELADVIQAAVETSRPLIEAGGHDLAIALPRDPVWLTADMVRLTQVFSNLLNNSAKYTERCGHISLSVDKTDGMVAVGVRDNGIGIPAEKVAGVFDMFSQIDSSPERRGGLGIGLALVRRLVEMHGGKVEARSEGPGRGSEFIVRLPLEAADAAITQSPPITDEPADTPDKHRRILIADDNEDAAVTLAMMLRLLGNDVTVVNDGLAAVEQAQRVRPEVCLLDIGMPGLNGYDAARSIREHSCGANLLLVALTGWGQEEDIQRAKQAGFDHHLLKPVDFKDLRRLLSAAGSRTVPVQV